MLQKLNRLCFALSIQFNSSINIQMSSIESTIDMYNDIVSPSTYGNLSCVRHMPFPRCKNVTFWTGPAPWRTFDPARDPSAFMAAEYHHFKRFRYIRQPILQNYQQTCKVNVSDRVAIKPQFESHGTRTMYPGWFHVGGSRGCLSISFSSVRFRFLFCFATRVYAVSPLDSSFSYFLWTNRTRSSAAFRNRFCVLIFGPGPPSQKRRHSQATPLFPSTNSLRLT